MQLDSNRNFAPGNHWDFPFCGADTFSAAMSIPPSYCSEYHKFKECRPRNKRTVKIINLMMATKYWVRFQIKNDANLSSTWSNPVMVETTCPDGTMLPVTACSCGLSNTFPAGFCNCESTQTYDACNVCNGPGIGEGKCDCNNNVNDICGVCGGDGIPKGFCDCNKQIELPAGKSSTYCGTLISLTNLKQTGASNNGDGSNDGDGSGGSGGSGGVDDSEGTTSHFWPYLMFLVGVLVCGVYGTRKIQALKTEDDFYGGRGRKNSKSF